MCMGGGSPKVEMPKAPPLPPPLPPPPPPKPPAPPPKQLAEKFKKPEIVIGQAKRKASDNRRTPAGQDTNLKRTLTIGNNQGLNI